MPNLFASETAVGYARVAVERSVDRFPDGLTYAIPAGLGDLQPGQRVIVPLGRGDTPTHGYIVERTRQTDLAESAHELKFILRRDESSIHLSHQLLDLARWISSYYCSAIGMTLA